MRGRMSNTDHLLAPEEASPQEVYIEASSDDGETEPMLSTQEAREVLPPKPFSKWKLFFVTVSFCGVQFGWAIQIAFATPIFLELGVSKTLVSLVWLAGPISGLIVQPTVGVISDKWNSKWGRRRPFIFWGTVCVIAGLLLISNASDIGKAFGDKGVGQNGWAIFLAIVGFWILDLSNNTIQGPCRALLVDTAPAEYQELGNAFFSFMLGLGNLGGYYVGSLNLAPAFPWMGTNMRALFTIGIVVEILCVSMTLIKIKEVPYKRPEGAVFENPWIKIFAAMKKMPSAMRRVCLVQFWAWIGWFAFIIYATAWVGEEIFNGDPNAPVGTPARVRYDDGVRKGAQGLALYSLVTLVYSPILPKLIERFGEKLVYFFGQMCFGASLIASAWIKTQTGAIIMIASCGIPWATTMCVPFSIVGRVAGRKHSGLYMGVFNIFVVLPLQY